MALLEIQEDTGQLSYKNGNSSILYNLLKLN